MSGPIYVPAAGKVPHKQLERVLVKQGEALQRLAKATAADFETYGQLQQQLKDLVVDLSVQVEALKVQIAGMLARMDNHGSLGVDGDSQRPRRHADDLPGGLDRETPAVAPAVGSEPTESHFSVKTALARMDGKNE